jgi:hypothetical protein
MPHVAGADTSHTCENHAHRSSGYRHSNYCRIGGWWRGGWQWRWQLSQQQQLLQQWEQ